MRRRRRRRLLWCGLLALVLVAASGTTAEAAVPPVSPRTASVVTADALATAQVNGVVWTTVIVGDRIIAGGEFTSARPPGAAPGTGERTRWNLVSVNLRTGALNNFAPRFNGPVKALAVSPDGRTLFVGGQFTRVGTAVRNRFAAFTISNSDLLDKNPSFNGTVNALAVTSSTVYAGGSFSTVDGVARSRLAAVRAFQGDLTAWRPSADNTVQALAVTGDRTKVIAGGSFNRVNTGNTRGLVALDARTGYRRTWRINEVVRNYGPNAAILSLAADGDTVYGTGYAYGGGNFEGVFAADDTEGAVRWIADCHGDTYDVVPVGNAVYSAGHAHFCGNIGGFPETDPRTYHRGLVMTRDARGTVAPNTQPSRSGNFGGQPGPSLHNWFPDLNAGTYTGLSQGPWAVAATSQYVVMAGEFTRVNGAGQQGIVRFTLPATQPVLRGPEEPGTSMTPTITGESGGTARVTWTANWDRDEMTLGYDVLRDGVVVGRVVRQSTFWIRPTLAFVDRGLVSGQTYDYRIRATHRLRPVTSPEVGYRHLGGAAQPAAEPLHQWRLSDDGAGTDRDRVGRSPLSIKNPAVLTGPGLPVEGSGTALALRGVDEPGATTTEDEPATGELSVELWVRTSGPGGTLASFGDRELSLDDSGRPMFAVGGTQVRGDASLTDDRWHQVVAVHSADGLRLHVDGEQVAARPAAVAAAGAGRWSLGAGLTGVLDEITVFDGPLSAADVKRRHGNATR